jgi:hypothetical protein
LASPVALPGAISLPRHDVIHVLLGRGLLNQDEGFVIGFTMGASSRLRTWQYKFFRWIARRLYPRPYKFSDRDLIAYDLGVGEGQAHAAVDLHKQPLETYRDMTIRDLRAKLGINVHRLHAAYRKERVLLADTPSSGRLDYDYKGADPSAILPPDGEESGWTRDRKKP